MLDAVGETIRSGIEKIGAILKLIDTTEETIKDTAPKIYPRELVELIFVQPYCKIGDVVEAGLAGQQTASVYLKALCEIGVLDERQAGCEKLFINPAFLRLFKR